MPRHTWIADDETGELLEPHVYYARRLADRDRCRTGSPTVINDWPGPVVSPIDGSVMTSRADMKEMCRRNGVIEAGDTGYMESMKRDPPKRTDFKPILHQVLRGDIKVPEKVKALQEGRLETPHVSAGLEVV